ncbi:MAG: hypothetical protein D8M57_07080 [Candidatus Scalindua sp. AMX11]|nr:MAG: hypothetical protein DWQ00_14650 [Candidatus Scalindua sp.]NOG85678.1 hypothetical protein [Planctomycetota bacterium]RZV82429.1 MAG: hypothetical protein EX341_09670 [Candidatus Scalindua sp. SCAELEC01]TDE65649.1 MAG: hypothetical protein D8M57_07080 [Candidatus Scalindua sp. AMX11]GJQ59153.1 MAG: hypothetical protein SCALA701_19540 [Candidatus Scalindua sp.]
MRYLANKTFQKDLKDYKLDDNYLHDVLDDIFKDRAQPLGAKMYQIRAARKGQGKRWRIQKYFFLERR